MIDTAERKLEGKRMGAERQELEDASVEISRRYLWVVDDITRQPALLPWVVEDPPRQGGRDEADIVRIDGQPLAELKRMTVPPLPAALIHMLRDRVSELHERVAMQGGSGEEFKLKFERLQQRVALLEDMVSHGAGEGGAGGGKGGRGGGGDDDGGGGTGDDNGHHTHRGPLYYADPEVFNRDLHATLQELADEWWPSVTPEQVAERMPQPISKGTLANRLRENGMLENNSLTWTIKKLYAQHRKKLV